MRITKENTIGVVIDMQEKLFPAMNNQEELLRNNKMLIAGLTELSVPVLVTQQYTRGLGNTLPEIADLISNFSFIEKSSFSCYDEPMFVEAVENHKVKNVVICGIESHVCVLQTAIDMKAVGYNPIVVTDCVSSRSENSKVSAIDRLRYENIMVTSAESLLFELLRTSTSPNFKAISKLVK